MSVVNRIEVERMATSLRMTFNHFAKGTYPVSGASSLHVNRLFTVIRNTDAERNYISDHSTMHMLKGGMIYFIPAHHMATVCLDDKIEFISTQFKMEAFPGIDVFSNSKRIFTLDDPRIYQRIRKTYNMKSDIASSVHMIGYVAETAGAVIEQLTDEELETVTRFSIYRKLLNYIARHCNAGTKVEDLAAVMNLGREAFTRKFTSDTGIPPKQFFNRHLLQHSCDLLCQARMPVKEVAFNLKFSSEYYFSRFFKTHTGMSPRQYQMFWRQQEKNQKE